MDLRHAPFMRRALELAQRGWGSAQPNPLVGAVVVRDGTVVGEGWHETFGGPHAEVNALRAAGPAAAGATLYVTLEPCAHRGKTPPCTDAIIAAGIGDVVFAAADPDPAARGGADVLRSAGIPVTSGVEHDAARALNAPFFHVRERQTPWFTLKLALSLDGRIAARPGERTNITGAAARAETHRLRSGYDAVLIGVGTALVDDPLLTVRDAPVRRQPSRVVLDTRARLPVESRLVGTVDQAPLVLLCGDAAPVGSVAALESAGVRVIRIAAGTEGVRPDAMVEALRQTGLHTIFVEGGSRVSGSLLQAGLVQRLHLFLAPVWLGAAAVPAFAVDAPIRAGWAHTQTTRHGEDLLLTLDRQAA